MVPDAQATAVKRILIIDDVQANRELIREALASDDYHFSEAESTSQALQIMRNQATHLVITDVRMPGDSGVDLLRQLHSEHPDTIVILVTAFGTVDNAVKAMKAGAHDYITRPLDLVKLQSLVQRWLEKVDVPTKVRIVRRASDRASGFDNMLGHSDSLLRVLDQAARIAATNATVLIQGETGTGKELLAQGIHSNSRRSAKPFVTVNCGAIPRDLLESELFGHVRGSFTGATMDRSGSSPSREKSATSSR